MKKIIFALGIGFLCVIALHFQFESTEAALSENFIRLHVLANSDEKSDQELKLCVRDRIIEETKEIFDENTDFSSAKSDINENLEKIKAIAEDEISENGYDYPVKVTLGMSDFPTKEYGELVLPKGKYEALRVEIGKAEGQNWWCVLFPPLCFVDESCVKVSSAQFTDVTDKLGEKNSEFLKKEKSSDVELKFKAYEIWQSGKKKLAMLFE